jgi:site-specific DNA-methyltransferase (adenine-specific)
MILLPIESITVRPHRQRQQFNVNAHKDLMASLSETAVGLQNPLVVRSEGESYILLSGERRLRAIKDLYEQGRTLLHAGKPVPSGLIPCTLTTELSELDAEEAELEENIRRVDLSWAEQASATARLMALRVEQGAQTHQPFPTVREIAVEVRGSGKGSYQEQTRRELIVAKHLDNPNVAAAKTLDEAFKVLQREERSRHYMELSDSLGTSISLASHTCLQVDCQEWLKEQPPAQFDVILSDPPYGIGADTFRDSDSLSVGKHLYDDSLENWQELMQDTLPHLFRLAKPDAHLYLFCDIDRFLDLRQRVTDSGWKVFRTPLIWHRPNGRRTPWLNKGPQRTYELILFAVKGDRQVNCIRGDVLTYPSDENIGHNAQKPVDLFKDLLERSALPGDRILDPFCGTGPIFPASTALKCLATGLELSPESFGIAASRLRGTS